MDPFKAFFFVFLKPPTDFKRCFSTQVDITVTAPPCWGVRAKLSSLHHLRCLVLCWQARMENEGNSKSVLRNLGWDRANMAGASKIKSR